MPLTEKQIVDLVRQWTVRTSEAAEEVLTDGFVYISETERHGRGDFIAAMNAQAPWHDVRILGVLIGAAQAATFFEGVDPTTNLSHRIAWMLDHDGSGIWKMTAVHGILSG